MKEGELRAIEHKTVTEDGKELFVWKLEQFFDGRWSDVPITRLTTDLRK